MKEPLLTHEDYKMLQGMDQEAVSLFIDNILNETCPFEAGTYQRKGQKRGMEAYRQSSDLAVRPVAGVAHRVRAK